MVKVIMGVKGSGKTKLLIDLVQKALDEEKGDVVVIEKDRSLTYDIPHQARLIVASDYPVLVRRKRFERPTFGSVE